MRGEYASMPPGQFEARRRGTSVFIRYIGYGQPKEGDIVIAFDGTVAQRSGGVWVIFSGAEERRNVTAMERPWDTPGGRRPSRLIWRDGRMVGT